MALQGCRVSGQQGANATELCCAQGRVRRRGHYTCLLIDNPCIFFDSPLTVSFTSRPYVDLVNILLTCGEEVKKAITRSVQAQCEQNWGSLCSILSFCTSAVHGDAILGPEKKPGEASKAAAGRGDILAHSDSDHRESSRASKGERGTKGHLNAHARVKAGGHGPKGAHGIMDRADELSDFSDIRR